ncbi:hypothetical protein ANCDUO_21659 [Ancylostoma duodenale]|uniref:Uncharacterized protein n=1 Tax=Ancylostoma duodenale TaxID=51022 RepID=A0A0C2BWC7_9BILA|nr:hypothetical protein ANCDUO_21659 [Ancylostoma duodenale]
MPHVLSKIDIRFHNISSCHIICFYKSQTSIFQQPELNVQNPAFQFSSTVELAHSKGGHMWGRFRMERENGSTFDVAIPTVVLESFDERNAGNIEKSVE